VKAFQLTPRDSETICPPCRDSIGAGATISCPDCGATYHEECAITFGVCVNLACVGRITTERSVVALPRIGAVARRLQSWRLDGLLRREGPWIVYFLPPTSGAPHSEPAARVVGEILDQTVFDGRLRLQARHPELLVRVEEREEVKRILHTLRGVGVEAYAISLADFIEPLEVFRGVAFFLDSPLVCSSSFGICRHYRLSGDRLVVPTLYLETDERNENWAYHTFDRKRKRSTRRVKRRSEAAFYVFRPNEIPLELTESGLQHVVGLSHRAAPRKTLTRVQRQFSGGLRAMTRSLLAVSDGRLQTPRGYDVQERGNRASVRLMLRLVSSAWQESLTKRDPKRALAMARH
jgi:hypothetical protein